MIQVVAVIVTKPGLRPEVLKTFKDNVPAVHSEAGCIEYTAYVDIESYGPPQTPYGPDAFVVIEKWKDASALKAHATSAHMAAYATKVKDKLISRTIHLLSAA